MSALDRLQLIQNAVTRLTLMYRALYGQAPAYVAELLQPYLSACSLRSNMLNLLSVPRTWLKTRSDQAFLNFGMLCLHPYGLLYLWTQKSDKDLPI